MMAGVALVLICDSFLNWSHVHDPGWGLVPARICADITGPAVHLTGHACSRVYTLPHTTGLFDCSNANISADAQPNAHNRMHCTNDTRTGCSHTEPVNSVHLMSVIQVGDADISLAAPCIIPNMSAPSNPQPASSKPA
jgi:hypothetical protein